MSTRKDSTLQEKDRFFEKLCTFLQELPTEVFILVYNQMEQLENVEMGLRNPWEANVYHLIWSNTKHTRRMLHVDTTESMAKDKYISLTATGKVVTYADSSAFFTQGLDRKAAAYILSYKDASDAWIDFGIPAFITFYEKTLDEVKKGK